MKLLIAIKLYVFGSPAVGNEALMRLISDKVPQHFSVENKQDIVPEVPLGESHLENEILFDQPEDLEPETLWVKIDHSGSRLMSKIWKIAKSIAAHSAYLSHYVGRR